MLFPLIVSNEQIGQQLLHQPGLLAVIHEARWRSERRSRPRSYLWASRWEGCVWGERWSRCRPMKESVEEGGNIWIDQRDWMRIRRERRRNSEASERKGGKKQTESGELWFTLELSSIMEGRVCVCGVKRRAVPYQCPSEPAKCKLVQTPKWCDKERKGEIKRLQTTER